MVIIGEFILFLIVTVLWWPYQVDHMRFIIDVVGTIVWGVLLVWMGRPLIVILTGLVACVLLTGYPEYRMHCIVLALSALWATLMTKVEN